MAHGPLVLLSPTHSLPLSQPTTLPPILSPTQSIHPSYTNFNTTICLSLLLTSQFSSLHSPSNPFSGLSLIHLPLSYLLFPSLLTHSFTLSPTMTLPLSATHCCAYSFSFTQSIPLLHSFLQPTPSFLPVDFSLLFSSHLHLPFYLIIIFLMHFLPLPLHPTLGHLLTLLPAHHHHPISPSHYSSQLLRFIHPTPIPLTHLYSPSQTFSLSFLFSPPHLPITIYSSQLH